MNNQLYARLLGDDWQKLDERIRCAHKVNTNLDGVFKITRGATWLAAISARCSGLPRASKAAETRLHIVADDTCERWERHFDGKSLTTKQWAETGGFLVERFGTWELIFRLRVDAGDLFYHQTGARLCLGPLRIAMPRFLAPRVVAKETGSDATRVLVIVTVTLPLAGLLIAYDGHLNINKTIS